MSSLGELIERQSVGIDLELGANGTIVDHNGRLICTINLRDLTLSEAFVYAELFCAAPRHCEALAALEAEAGR